MQTHNDLILKYLKTHGTITAMQALDNFGCFRLSARIYELRALGHDIDTQIVRTTTGKNIAQYRLKEKKRPALRVV